MEAFEHLACNPQTTYWPWPSGLPPFKTCLNHLCLVRATIVLVSGADDSTKAAAVKALRGGAVRCGTSVTYPQKHGGLCGVNGLCLATMYAIEDSIEAIFALELYLIPATIPAAGGQRST